ncbi:hypothetical protein ACIQC9_12055 [Brevundimonas sp. NPDC092305]|uniref:hypothetical protein n=1 Tax=Brevundimonas sp. NPDC092305 TaxID=3363957 RepID=UPI00382E7487
MAAVAPVVEQQPNWDALATSLALVGTGLTIGGLVLALAAIIVGFAWAKLVKRDAEEEARKEARACVERLMVEWRANELPALVRQNVEIILNASAGDANDLDAADRMGEGAGD